MMNAEEITVKIIKNIHQVFAKQSGKISTHNITLHFNVPRMGLNR